MSSTQQKKCRTGDVLLEHGDHNFAREFALAVWHMLLFIVQHAKDSRMLTQIQEANDMNIIIPLVLGAQMHALAAMIKLSATKKVIQHALALLRMWLNQNSILCIGWMMRRDQEGQHFKTIGIEPDLIALRMRRRNVLSRLRQL